MTPYSPLQVSVNMYLGGIWHRPAAGPVLVVQAGSIGSAPAHCHELSVLVPTRRLEMLDLGIYILKHHVLDASNLEILLEAWNTLMN